MSERAELQQELADFIGSLERPDGRSMYDAPYGVITGMMKLGRGGYARTITFGCARTLDAFMLIFGDSRIVIQADGPQAWRIDGEYGSVEAVKEVLNLSG